MNSPFFTFLFAPEWDSPFFKVLARNDTAQARGHQGGMVLPKVLRKYLPQLDEAATSAARPTVERYLLAEMYHGFQQIARAPIRYQFQTWRGTRPAESRLTEGFLPLRELAAGGDLIIFQRRLEALDNFRVLLVKSGSPEHRELSGHVGGRKCGPLAIGLEPTSQEAINYAKDEIAAWSAERFAVSNNEVRRTETRQNRIARSVVFREKVRTEYHKTCAVSGFALSTPAMANEVEAAHIVPISEGGLDDIRNGITLTQTLHWAFDRGLFGVSRDRTIFVPRRAAEIVGNAFIMNFSGRPIREAATPALKAHRDAFEWHMEHRVIQWH